MIPEKARSFRGKAEKSRFKSGISLHRTCSVRRNDPFLRGYVLIEVLVASVLLSIAGSGLYTGLLEGIKANRMVRESDAVYDPLRKCWMRMEKDLQNSLYLREVIFTGKEEEMSFPVLVIKEEKGEKRSELRAIRYFVKNGTLIRSEQKLSNHLVSENPVERVLLKGMKSLKFQYAYLDEEEKLQFQPFWVEEPYFGIPKAVRVDVKDDSVSFSKLIAIPQGKWGRLHE